MKTVGRTKPKGILKWNQASEIRGNVRYVMAATENFCTVATAHSARINEIRMVRNHIAHGNPGTKALYQGVVARRLGAAPRKYPRPGAFVLRQTPAGVLILTEYVVSLSAIVKAMAKA